MNAVSTVDQVRNIALEVASYRQDYDEQRQRAGLAKFTWSERGPGSVLDNRFAIGVLAYSALEYSREVIAQADRQIFAEGGVSALTRRTLAATALTDPDLRPMMYKPLKGCCLAAELKFVHDTEHNLSRAAPRSHMAALILHDVAGEPLAYQKTTGEAQAYVWRDGIIQTRAGKKQLFAGSIVKPLYYGINARLPPHMKFAGREVVGIKGCVADNIEFKRLSLEFLPERIRSTALFDASGLGVYEEYRCHVGEAVAMNTFTFGQRMADLARVTQNYTLAL